MRNPKSHPMPPPIAVGQQEFRLSKEGVTRFDFRDPYHSAVSLSWPAFTAAMLVCWLATVGYGVMAPATPYGHIVTAVEIVSGMAFTAIFTGLLFVRFSRARPRSCSPTPL
jgi:inward rectifier potassium channel